MFSGGPAELNSFANQMRVTLMDKPEMPVFQYFRGILWILCLIPLFKNFTGGRLDLIILSALTVGLLPTAQLAFPNPLMPDTVSLYHFGKTLFPRVFLARLVRSSYQQKLQRHEEEVIS